jgi:hypothetical protein
MQISKMVSLTIITLLFAVNVEVSMAGDIKRNDQELMINVGPDGCAKSVDLVSAVDNCADSAYANSCGKNGNECICMRSQKFVSWKVSNDSPFEIQFQGTRPFKRQCNLKSGDKAKLRCKITVNDGDFNYDVIVKTCPGQVYDPKIVVR